MRSAILFGLLGAALQVNGHPVSHNSHASSLRRRAVNLNAFRLKATAEYINSNAATSDASVASVKLLRRDTYVETATELVKRVAPGAEFRVVDDHYVGSNGVAHVHFKQTAHGLDIDNADINVNVAADGTILSYGNNFFKGEIPAESPLAKRAFNDPVVALGGASKTLALGVSEASSAEPLEAPETYVLKGTSGAEKDPEAKLMYLVKADGDLALTWRVETDLMDNWLLTYVDAASNEQVHGVVDYVSEATYEVFPWGINDPTEGERESLTNPWDKTASPFGWQGDGSKEYTTTEGNNAIAQVNPSGGSSYRNNYRPNSPSGNFTYDYSLTMSPPSSYRDASVTQLFYTANQFHDLLYQLGFNEVAGNFQTNNNGKGGKGNDFAILDAQDGSRFNNAQFASPPDGQPGRMRMYLWNYSNPQRDGVFESGIVIHEYAHGLSTRLTGGPANSNCLNSLESGGMGEGWSDFYATAARLKPSDTRKTDYSMGAWASTQPKGIRAVLYSTDLTVNPNTYETLNTLDEVHDIGETWATMLYEVMWNLIDKHGKNDTPVPVLENGVPTDGKYLAMKLVMDGMALQPCNPNYIQARDAILDADTALTKGDNQCEIWTAFAKRGLGEGASYNSGRRTGSTKIPAGVC